MSSKYNIIIWGVISLCRDIIRIPALYLQISPKFSQKSSSDGIMHKLSDSGLLKVTIHDTSINLMSDFILGLLSDLYKEGRGEGKSVPSILGKARMSRVVSHVSQEAYLFQGPESINAHIIPWIPLFSAAKWLGQPCMKPISNFQSKTHPRTTYGSL